MATIKSYTDLSQSKVLATILPLESADACWTNHLFDSLLSSWRIKSTTPQEYKALLDRFVVRGYLIEPCWSLASLLEQFPYELCDDDGNSLYLEINKEDDIYQLVYADRYGDFESIETDRHEHFVDACYEMVIRLRELNLL